MFKDIKKTMSKELRCENSFLPKNSINKKTEIIKKNNIKILELKSTIMEINNSLDGLNNRSELAEEST